MGRSWAAGVAAFLWVLLAAFGAAAQVRVTFYSKPWDSLGYPHAFVRVTGTPEWAPQGIDETYGFTTNQQHLVFSKARGHVESASPAYIAASTAHFWVEISDDEWRSLRAFIDGWNSPPGSDYNLNRRNCVVFVAEIGRRLGLSTGAASVLKPQAYLEEMRGLNASMVMAGAAPLASGLLAQGHGQREQHQRDEQEDAHVERAVLAPLQPAGAAERGDGGDAENDGEFALVHEALPARQDYPAYSVGRGPSLSGR